ncbi:tRNA(Met) cytidine acetyltransferase TmcA [Enterobacter sp. CC120223-11]|uniref:tRNA(Met) cytidine acetyltransferase TmcA n=1 Tax=Enterobacter sp. CC120223-11 TaxID=1378073 RepID=UPI000BD41B6E|nr:GNAT family N-acetyltransferase [Enterobacter sp. CC120223-11]SNY70960.1 tRNA(Met)-cytidine N(4)-acetyltransferase [Enterobacter sp. CC120223-11]
MTDREAILALTATMKAQGIRRLLVLSGEVDWAEQQAQWLRETLGGDGLFISPHSQPEPWCAPSAVKTLLGREFEHALFDARDGFDVAAFAALAGTLKAGSWLVLLTPDLNRWHERADADSIRWSDSPEPILTPHFVHHFCRTLQNDAEALIWQQPQPFALPEFAARPAWHAANGEPQAEQADILTALKSMPPGVAVVTAERGRGKSALAGMHLRTLPGTAIVTAPARAATDVLAHFAGERFRFMAPDALLASSEQADWLIVDEAAAIPGPLLEKLVKRFQRALLTTTVQGYEGTGRGFLLKFCARFSHLKTYSLHQPVRWASGCPLEIFVAQALLFDDALPELSVPGPLSLRPVEQSAWQQEPDLPASMYRLLCAAHYRTSPLDLRRMMDAPGQHFVSAQEAQDRVGALWLVEEGGLSKALSEAVWAGFRRPRGNLVAQSLAAHGGSPQAATLRSRRVSRIAIHPQRQRQGIGQRMIEQAIASADGCDYLSVSFGFTDELWRFWQKCGFRLLRLGTHREASSGCYSAMAIYPLNAAGQALAEREQQRFARDEAWLAAWRDESTPTANPPSETILTEDDWQELAGFAFAHRPLMAAVGSLNRLVATVALPSPALRSALQPQSPAAQAHGGRKALLAQLREETAHALISLDPQRTQRLADKVKNLQFF